MQGKSFFWHGGVRSKLDFSANINPFPPPERIKKVYASLWEELTPYPEPLSTSLREALARNYGGSPENYLVSNGSSEVFFLLMWGLDFWRAIIPYPTYGEYERVVQIFKKKVIPLPLSPDFQLNLSSLPAPRGKELVFLCHPNNPTGNFLLPSPSLPRVEGRIWIVDETYIELTSREGKMSFLPQALEREDIIVIRSFTKTYSLAGLRLGYLVAQQQKVRELYKKVISWSVSHVAQRVGEEVLKEKGYLEETRKKIAREREFMYRELSRTRFFHAYPSTTNFIMVKLPAGAGSKLKEYLLERNVFIRFLDNIRGLGEDYVRISVRRRKENQLLITYLKEFIPCFRPIASPRREK
ncbi:MAG: histidinol-phosphate aminotransferase family protein [Caldiserica bacterium]|nr:histidinol-phosphate aminotransferase family protein [Caldisericota bacterium]